jgi:hypothetical protein
MVAMNSIPQQEVAKGMAKVNLHEPYLQHHLGCGENPSPTTPSGGSTIYV